MMPRTLARVAAAASGLVLIGAVWAAFAPAADAVTGVESGYWSNLPAAPQVPAGGVEVGSDANGPQAVAAVRFQLATGESSPVMRLKVAQAAPPQAQIVIEACAVADRSAAWKPPAGGGPGAMSDAPAPDCTHGLVHGVVAADASTVTFDLSLLSAGDSVVDVVLQPGKVASPASGVPGAPSDQYPTFDVAFAPVTASEIAVDSSATTAALPASSGNSGSGAYGTSATGSSSIPANGAPSIALPPATTTTDGAGAAPVVAAGPQPTNAAASSPVQVVKKRSLRTLFGIAMLSSDLLFGLLWLERRLPGPGDRPLITIYDPPPLPGT
jgi:hypothetical protein